MYIGDSREKRKQVQEARLGPHVTTEDELMAHAKKHGWQWLKTLNTLSMSKETRNQTSELESGPVSEEKDRTEAWGSLF